MAVDLGFNYHSAFWCGEKLLLHNLYSNFVILNFDTRYNRVLHETVNASNLTPPQSISALIKISQLTTHVTKDKITAIVNGTLQPRSIPSRCFSFSNSYVITINSTVNSSICLYNKASGDLEVEVTKKELGFTTKFTSACVNHDESMLASMSEGDPIVALFQITEKKLKLVTTVICGNNPLTVGFSPDSRYPQLLIHTLEVESIYRYLITTSEEKHATLFDINEVVKSSQSYIHRKYVFES